DERQELADYGEQLIRTLRWTYLIVYLGSLAVVGVAWFSIRHDLAARARAEAEAVAANPPNTAFLAMMSHRIPTPMNGVLGMTQLCLDTRLTEEQRDYLQSVMASGEALVTIVNDILDFSKIEAGKLELDCAEFNLRTLIGESMKVMAPRAQQKGV